MKDTLRWAVGWMLVLFGLSSAATASGSMDRRASWTIPQVCDFISGWPEISRLTAVKTMEKYGRPDEIEAGLLMWDGNRPWLRTTVYRDEDFTRRSGVLEQAVAFETPVGRWRDLDSLSIGVAYDPVGETLSASSESEEINTLALNVAVDVIQGRREVSEARKFYLRTLDASLSGKSSSYTRGLRFSQHRRKIRTRPTWLQPLMP